MNSHLENSGAVVTKRESLTLARLKRRELHALRTQHRPSPAQLGESPLIPKELKRPAKVREYVTKWTVLWDRTEAIQGQATDGNLYDTRREALTECTDASHHPVKVLIPKRLAKA